jgi:hypothetical protein
MLLLCIGAISALSVFLVIYAATELETDGAPLPEIVLPLLVIVGVIALLASLAIAAATYGLFEMSDKSQALGLPAGSVQAVIALSLILIFAVVALFTRSQTGMETYDSSGLTGQEFKEIPKEEVVSYDRRERKNGTVTYHVVRRVDDPEAKDANTQLLATVSTLVVAVAGFYFGSRSVQEGSQAVLDAAGPTRTLGVVYPHSPYLMEGWRPVDGIRVQSVPPSAQLNWYIEGDKGGSLARLQNGKFVYRPGKELKQGQSVTLRFEQVDDPKISDTLLVEVPLPEDAPSADESGDGSPKDRGQGTATRRAPKRRGGPKRQGAKQRGAKRQGAKQQGGKGRGAKKQQGSKSRAKSKGTQRKASAKATRRKPASG